MFEHKYIGRKSITGEKLYEGEIVRFKICISQQELEGRIKYNETLASFRIETFGQGEFGFDQVMEVEII